MKLTPRQVQRLRKLKNTRPEGFLSYDQFRNAIGAPFSSQTLLNAMRGNEIHPSTYHFLIGVLAKHAPEGPAAPDGQTAASGRDTDTAAAGESTDSDEGDNTRESGQESQDGHIKRGSR